MCKYCDSLEYKNIIVPIRTSMSDDNICDKVHADKFGNADCSNCEGCRDENQYFKIASFNDNLDISYYHKIGDVVIAPVSCRFSINFCPMCGKRISKEFYYEDLKFW